MKFNITLDPSDEKFERNFVTNSQLIHASIPIRYWMFGG